MPSGTAHQNQLDATSAAITSVLTPVMICMALAVWFVNSLGDPEKCASRRPVRAMPELGLYQTGVSSEKTVYSNVVVVVSIAIFLVLMVGFTFLVVWLYKTGRQRYIKIWLIVAVSVIFGYVGGTYIYDFAFSRCIDLDWITLIVAVWNFTISGLFAVFGSAPRLINQSYLIVMSALMANIFRGLPAVAVWIILGVLVVWDLYAVLSPRGPLRVLVELARERKDDLPALVYDTNPVDAGRELIHGVKKPHPATRPRPQPHAEHSTAVMVPGTHSGANAEPVVAKLTVDAMADAMGAAMPDASSGEPSTQATRSAAKDNGATASTAGSGAEATHSKVANSSMKGTQAEKAPKGGGNEGEGEGFSIFDEGQDGAGPTPQVLSASKKTKLMQSKVRRRVRDETEVELRVEVPQAREVEENLPVGTMGSHLKLGLGDFVFYSILVAQASQAGTMTTIMSFVAILAGLCSTLFLVTVCRKALPALPISITVALVIYFLVRLRFVGGSRTACVEDEPRESNNAPRWWYAFRERRKRSARKGLRSSRL